MRCHIGHNCFRAADNISALNPQVFPRNSHSTPLFRLQRTHTAACCHPDRAAKRSLWFRRAERALKPQNPQALPDRHKRARVLTRAALRDARPDPCWRAKRCFGTPCAPASSPARHQRMSRDTCNASCHDAPLTHCRLCVATPPALQLGAPRGARAHTCSCLLVSPKRLAFLLGWHQRRWALQRIGRCAVKTPL